MQIGVVFQKIGMPKIVDLILLSNNLVMLNISRLIISECIK